MTRRSGSTVVSVTCATALVLWAGLAQAGAPAAPPEGGGGPHEPEHQIAQLGAFTFESGAIVPDLRISYVTHGNLNENEDNIILVMQHFMGDHHDLDFLIGPGKALDTDKYFVVATDCISNARLRQDVSTGPTNSGLKMNFPTVTMLDSVNAEVKLLTEYLAFDHIFAAIGSSMGAQKGYQLAVSYPDFVDGIVAIAGGPSTNLQIRTQARSMRDIIALDSGWYSGNYQQNPVMGVNTALMNFVPWLYGYPWFGENITSDEADADFGAFWNAIWTQHWPQDARDIYYQLETWGEFSVGDTPGFAGNVASALASIKAQVLMIGATHDMMVRPEEYIIAMEAIPNATHIELDSPAGHLICCGFDPEATEIMDREVAKFLSRLR